MKRSVFLLALGLVIILTSCGGATAAAGKLVKSNVERAAPSGAEVALADDLTAQNHEFALRLYGEIKDQAGNLMFSPYSLSVALAMTYAGARGETERQMAEALGFDLTGNDLHAAFNWLDLQLKEQAADAYTLEIAQAVWGQQDLPYRPDYLDVLARYYDAGLRTVDFVNHPEEAVRQANAWASEQTHGKIPQVVNEFSPDTRGLVLNAIYFYATWADPFQPDLTSPRPFYPLAGEAVDVPTMFQHEYFRYTQGDGYRAVELPYRSGAASMVIVLPDAGTFSEFEGSLTAADYEKILAGLRSTDLRLYLPRWTSRTSLELKDALKALGMRDAFDPYAADFSGIAGAAELYLSRVFQKTYISVDEQGTEAAAVSGVQTALATVAPPPVIMMVDHPFLYFIRDTATGTILFAGRVLNPVGE